METKYSGLINTKLAFLEFKLLLPSSKAQFSFVMLAKKKYFNFATFSGFIMSSYDSVLCTGDVILTSIYFGSSPFTSQTSFLTSVYRDSVFVCMVFVSTQSVNTIGSFK